MKVNDACPSCKGAGMHYNYSYHNGNIEGPGWTCEHCEGSGAFPRAMKLEERVSRLEYLLGIDK